MRVLVHSAVILLVEGAPHPTAPAPESYDFERDIRNEAVFKPSGLTIYLSSGAHAANSTWSKSNSAPSAAACARFRANSFLRIEPTWNRAVRAATCNVVPISRSVWPLASKRKTSTSRSVSASNRPYGRRAATHEAANSRSATRMRRSA